MSSTGRWPVAALGIAFVAVAAWLHLEAGFSLPRPWPDESHFLAPALQLARHGTLDVPSLNAPDGIFWLPHGYYVLLAPLLALPVPALDAARWLSFACVVAFAGCVAWVAGRRGVPALLAVALPGAWLLLPRVVMAADIARMEAPVLALAGAGLVLAERDRWPAAMGLGVLAGLVHPIGAVVLAAFGATALAAGRRRWRVTRTDAVVLVLVVLAAGAQVAYFLAHWDLTREQLAFQLQRKARRGIQPDLLRWSVGACGLMALAAARRRPVLLGLGLLAVGLLVIDVVGREQWYWVLGAETALLLLAVALAAVAPRPLLAPAAGAVAGIAVLGVAMTLWQPVAGMRAASSDRAEWFAFAAAAVADLRAYDAEPGPARTVLVDPLSGFGQELAGQPWQRLRFVQATPVTPLDLSAAQLYLATSGAPFRSETLFRRWQAGPPVVDTRSSTGAYRLLLVPRACAPRCPAGTSSLAWRSSSTSAASSAALRPSTSTRPKPS